MRTRLYKDDEDSQIAGVCKGLADYLDIDPTIIRLIFLIGLMGYGSFLILYLVLYIILPNKTEIQ